MKTNINVSLWRVNTSIAALLYVNKLTAHPQL